MTQTLTQSEVDKLLSAVSKENIDLSQKTNEEDNIEVIPYDLTNQDRISRGRMPTLDIIYERFIRLYRLSLSNALRKMASISIMSTDLMRFGEFVNTLSIPSCICIMRFESLKGPALIVFDSKLTYLLVDSFFGGNDRPYNKVEGKEFTRIELSIMRKVIDFALKDFEEAWTPVHKTDISFSRIEVNPQFVGVVPPSDVIISTRLKVEVESTSGTINLVIPYSTIEPIKSKLSASFQNESDKADKEWIGKLQEHIMNTESTLLVNLGSASITVGDLINLNIGDVILLNQNADTDLNVFIEGVEKFKCFFGNSRGNRAIKISQTYYLDSF
jgi:flagellar motor switch protein FliM